ncbi:187-kda microtubule-associated protein air9 [Phtheirospermum japonicum]|uniref:187-kDa microtubule-associated protein air9 n=1 Tax=Phtheirospermum japonicum TaxID=374723 RepID=A0A830B642_9LAMI|nr:187-kda microtubule-associated protein air9 [Phtheirospermum japonicum]
MSLVSSYLLRAHRCAVMVFKVNREPALDKNVFVQEARDCSLYKLLEVVLKALLQISKTNIGVVKTESPFTAVSGVQLSFLNKWDQLCQGLQHAGRLSFMDPWLKARNSQLSFIASYSGGEKGDCLYEWFRVKDDGFKEKLHVGGEPVGVELLIPDCCEGQEVVPATRTYTPSLEDVGFYLALYWLPTRSDGKCGSALVSICDSPVIPAIHQFVQIQSSESLYFEPSDVVLPEVPRIEILALTGKAVEGELLTAVEVIPNSENQHLVWGKYKKEVKYQWFFSSESGTDKFFEPFPSQRSCSYKVRFEGIGRYLRRECVVTDVFGRSSELAQGRAFLVFPPSTPSNPAVAAKTVELETREERKLGKVEEGEGSTAGFDGVDGGNTINARSIDNG